MSAGPLATFAPTPSAPSTSEPSTTSRGDGTSPASRFQHVLSALRRLELGRASDRDRGHARAALRLHEKRLRELTLFDGRRAEDAARVTSGTVTLSHGVEARLGELDIEHASKIAVALDVNEIASVELIVGAIENGAPADDVAPSLSSSPSARRRPPATRGAEEGGAGRRLGGGASRRRARGSPSPVIF